MNIQENPFNHRCQTPFINSAPVSLDTQQHDHLPEGHFEREYQTLDS